MLLSGKVHNFGLSDKEQRKYLVCTVPLVEARQHFKAEVFSSKSGKGEQRPQIQSHARKLKRAMETNHYTPTTVHVGLRPRHKGLLEVMPNGHAKLDLKDDDKLPLTNGQHRILALNMIYSEVQEKLKKSKDDNEREKLREQLHRIGEQPVTTMVLLDGNTQEDFVNLQLGKTVDSTHLLTIRIKRGLLNDNQNGPMKTAFQVATLLESDINSPFYKQIRFDQLSHAYIPVNSIMAKGSSDSATSLLGLVKVCEGKSVDEIAGYVVKAYTAIKETHPDVFEKGKILTPPPEGSKGSASMIIGVAIGLAYVSTRPEHEKHSSIKNLVSCVRKTLDDEVGGSLSGPEKRTHMRNFMETLLNVEILPDDLLKLLNASAFGIKRDKEETNGEAASEPVSSD